MRRALVALAVLSLGLGAAVPAGAQARPDLRVLTQDGSRSETALRTDRGYAAVPGSLLAELGWRVAGPEAGAWRLTAPDGDELLLRPESPFVRWGDEVVQLADPVWSEGGELFVPAQLVTDFLPRRFPDRYDFDGPTLTLRAAVGPLPAEGEPADATSVPSRPEVERRPAREAAPAPPREAAAAPPRDSARTAGGRTAPARASESVLGSTRDDPAPPAEPTPPEAAPERTDLDGPTEYDGVRVVVIDAGHGGRDPGSIGVGGLREKTVALGVARALARRLEGTPGVEVRMIRDDDTFVPIWDRGKLATEMKGDRPGVLVSIHANAFSSSARGFETYFLSEARTDHERRVAAIENAPVHVEREQGPVGDDLDFILRELRNLDHQHWSHLLAELVQEDMDGVHPGPDRGVKQAPLAVITNALMPAVLVEVGFVSHAQEARLLGTERFQEDAGRAIADSVLRFFERYPPGSWSRAGEGR